MITKQRILKGCSRNVIVVKSPAPMFSEAIFLLKDELFTSSDADCRSLLSQAEAAAKQYSLELKGKKAPPPYLKYILPALLSSAITALICLII